MNLKFGTAAFLLFSLSGVASTDLKQHAYNKPAPEANQVTSKKKAALRLYPNPSTTGTVRVVSNTAGQLNFYVFDLDGTMLHQAVISEKQKHTITNLGKGVYTYDAFYNDEGIEHGKIIVK